MPPEDSFCGTCFIIPAARHLMVSKCSLWQNVIECCSNKSVAVEAADNCNSDKLQPKSSPVMDRLIWGLGEAKVNRTPDLPRRLPVGTKYIVESCGRFVRRFVELPNGARIPLRKRKLPGLRRARKTKNKNLAAMSWAKQERCPSSS